MMKNLKWILLFIITLIVMIPERTFADGQAVLAIPDGVTAIEEEAFFGDTSLDTVIMPEGVLSVGSRAFADSSLHLIMLPSTLEFIADDAIGKDVKVIAPPGSMAFTWAKEKGYLLAEETPDSDFQYTITNGRCTITKYLGAAESIIIPSTIEGAPVVAIGGSAFSDKKSILYLSVPESVTDIGSYAFSGCSSLHSIRLPQLTVLNMCLFQGCSSLKNLDIPTGVTTIKGGAFRNSGIETVQIPNSVTAIESSVFYGCADLKSVEIPSGVSYLNESLFEGCVSLESVSLPDTIQGYYGSVFKGCSSLEYIALPDNSHIYKNSSYIFAGCTSLRNIVLPVSSAIPAHAFYNCTHLESIHIPDTTTIIEEHAFDMCVSLNTVEFGSGSQLSTVADYAFAYCSSLERIDLPQYCRVVKEKSFYGCYNLKTFTYNDRYEVSDYVARYGVTFPAYYYIGLGSTTELPIHFLDGIDHEYILSSSNDDIISVSGRTVTGKASGEATVSITVPHMQSGGRNFVRSISVYVGLELNKKEMTVESGESIQLKHTYDVFLESTYPFITGEEIWSSTDQSIASVDSEGIVTGHLMGEAVISLSVPTNAGTMNASCTVTVVPDQNTLDQIIRSIRYTWTENYDEYTVTFNPIEETHGMTFNYGLYGSDSINGEYELLDSNAAIVSGEGIFASYACPSNESLYLRILVTEFSNGFPVRVRFTNPVSAQDPRYDPVVYRAILIGEPNAMNRNEARFSNDANRLTTILGTLNDGNIETFNSPYIDLTADEAENLIDTAFKSATENDVSVFYISTHGVGVNTENVSKGDLTMVHNQSYLKLGTLGSKMREIKGIKIVILESCLSGKAMRQESFHDDSIILFTACDEDEESRGGAEYVLYIEDGDYFSRDIYNTLKNFSADNNPKNGVMTPKEFIDYVTEKTSSWPLFNFHPQSLCPGNLENYPLFWK